MEPVFPNRINGVIRARLNGLKSMLEESSHIEHAATKGALRERYLTELLRSLLPPKFVVTGGFITDVLGNVTPQIDLILADTTSIPSVALAGEVAFVPVEAAIEGVEVKSTLTSHDLDQIKTQAQAIRSLRPIAENPQPGVALWVFAFESRVKEDRLRVWLEEVPEVIGVCIFNQYFIRKDYGPNTRDFKTVSGSDNDCKETLVFMSSLLCGVSLVQERRSPQTLTTWCWYIVGADPAAAQPAPPA